MQWYFISAKVPSALNADQVLSILQDGHAKLEGMSSRLPITEP